MIKLILDAMGGDNAPFVTVAGAVEALKNDKEISLILTGRKDDIEAELKKYSYDSSRLEIVDCPDAIGMNDDPIESLRRKDSSLMTAFRMLKNDDEICGLVTAGSTGATIAGGQVVLGRMRGVTRAAVAPAIPNSRGEYTVLIDSGANVECKPAMLCQFAILGSAYAKIKFGKENPAVGLLSNGTEEHKGDAIHQEAYRLLKKVPGINFVGNIEGRDICFGNCDVVVSDGFSGNVALKSIEGTAKLVSAVMKKEFSANLRTKIGYLFLRKAIKRMLGQLDFDKVGGALLLGLKKPVVKSHGSSKVATISNAIANLAAVHKGGLVSSLESELQKVDFNSLIAEINE